jgi:ADP-heptose:LPS heptosyltransferase
MKRILAVSTTGMGDCLMSGPALRALRKSFPGLHIDFVVNAAWKSLFLGNPHVSRLIGYHSQWYRQPFVGLRLWDYRYDQVLILHANRNFGRLMPWIRTASVWATQPLPWVPEDRRALAPVHGIAKRIGLVEKIGGRDDGGRMEIFFDDKDRARNAGFMKSQGLAPGEFVYLNPVGATCKRPRDRWPIENFAEIARNILAHTSCKIVLGGGPRERRLMESLRAGLDQSRTVNVCKRSIRDNAFLLGQARLLITSDTGPMHAGFALKVPTVAFFGPGDPRVCGPYQLEPGLCAVMQSRESREFHDNQGKSRPDHFQPITVDTVWEKVRDLLKI